MNYLKLLTKGALLVIATVGLTSCLKNRNTEYVEPDISYISVFHAAAGTGNTDLYVDGRGALQGIKYKDKTPYLGLYSGTRGLLFMKSGFTNPADSIRSAKVTLKKDSIYSVFLTGVPNAVTTFLVRDKLEAPATGKTNIRFINLSPDGGLYTLKQINDNDETVLFEDINYRKATAFIAVTPGSYKLGLYQGATKITELESTLLSEKKNYTIWVAGLVGSSDNNLKPFIKIDENK